MSNNISFSGKALIGISKIFKKTTDLIDPSNKRLDLINLIINNVPGPFLINRKCEPFSIVPEYNPIDGDLIKGEITYKSDNDINNSETIIFYIHGGAFLLSNYKMSRFLTSNLCKHAEAVICSFDYRFGHQYPFPYSLMDTIQIYKWFINEYNIDQKKIVIMGDSAGGNLAVSLMATIILEKMGFNITEILNNQNICELIPDDVIISKQTKGLVLLSPWLDLTQSNETYKENSDKDTLLPASWIPYASKTYLGESLNDPHFLASPFKLERKILNHFPPTIIHVCENEMLLDDARKFADNIPNEVVLKIYPPLPHVFHLAGRYVEESKQAILEIADFIKKLN